MNNREAKQILALFRPGTADEVDPFFSQARQLAKTDPDLAAWLDSHAETFRVLRGKFQAIPVPPGLKEQILSERKIQRSLFQEYWRPILAAAAVVVLLAGLASAWRIRHAAPDGYAAYRKRMTEFALRSYSMDLKATDPAVIRNFLKERNAPADYSLPDGLITTAVSGCAVSTWQGSPVSLICFKSGRPLPPGNQSDLWLFVTDLKSVPNAPPPGAPVFARVNKAATASWSDGARIYLLAAVGDEAMLRKYLQ